MEYDQNEQKPAGALRIVNAGLRKHKLWGIEIPGDGNFQFHAFVKSADLHLSPYQLRLEACNYFKHFLSLFADFECSFSRFDDYLPHMRQPGSWGDQLTLIATCLSTPWIPLPGFGPFPVFQYGI
eukprot:3420285-Pyramimonas_sp.AAC.1